jgi:hypothetical protein
VNPVPLTDPALMVMGAVPVEVIVTDCVAGVFRVTVPKATLLLPNVRVGVVAFSAKAKVFVTPPEVAVSVAVWFVLTAAAVAVKPALVSPATIVTEAGTVTELLLLDKLTVVALVAAEVNVTVQVSVPAPASDPLLQETALSVAGACPVPLRLIVVVPPVEALLLIVTDPLKAPAVVGSKLIVSVAVCFGFSVIGELMPDSAKPVPAADTPLIVCAAVPDEISVTVFAAVVLSASAPNATLVELKLRAAVVAFSVRAKVFETPPDVAVSVADWFVLTAAAVAVKLALEAPAAMVTEAGTVTALLLLAKVTIVALVAADVNVTVQASVPTPVSDPLLQETALSVAVCPGFSVIGPLIPDSENPAPVIDTSLTVNAAVPEDVSVTVLPVEIFNASAPKATLVALSVIAGDEDDGFNSSEYVSEIPFDVAVSVTVCGELAADTVAVNGSLVSWVHTYMAAGTWTDALLLLSVTFRMPDVLRFIVTVQVVVPAALNVRVLHDRPESSAVAPKEASGKHATNKLSRPARRHRRRPLSRPANS